jgi:hypothetical protein
VDNTLILNLFVDIFFRKFVENQSFYSPICSLTKDSILTLSVQWNFRPDIFLENIFPSLRFTFSLIMVTFDLIFVILSLYEVLKSFKYLGVVNTLMNNPHATSKILNFNIFCYLSHDNKFQDVNLLRDVTHQFIGPHTLKHSLNQK